MKEHYLFCSALFSPNLNVVPGKEWGWVQFAFIERSILPLSFPISMSARINQLWYSFYDIL